MIFKKGTLPYLLRDRIAYLIRLQEKIRIDTNAASKVGNKALENKLMDKFDFMNDELMKCRISFSKDSKIVADSDDIEE